MCSEMVIPKKTTLPDYKCFGTILNSLIPTMRNVAQRILGLSFRNFVFQPFFFSLTMQATREKGFVSVLCIALSLVPKRVSGT